MVLIDRPLTGTDILVYVKERSSYWDCIRQCVRNELVGCIARSYADFEDFADKNDSVKRLEQFAKNIIEEKHPQSNLQILDIVVPKIVAEDIYAYIDGRPYFKSYDFGHILTEIKQRDIIETIRRRDGIKPMPIEKKSTEEQPHQQEQKPLTRVVKYFASPWVKKND